MLIREIISDGAAELNKLRQYGVDCSEMTFPEQFEDQYLKYLQRQEEEDRKKMNAAALKEAGVELKQQE